VWVTAFVVTLLVFGIGQLEAWPFTSWYMFSHVEQTPARVARPIAMTARGEFTLTDRTLPYGLLSHRLLQRIDDGSHLADVCASLTTAARRDYRDLIAVRVVERRWDPLKRAAGNRPVVDESERLRCPA
jgi:hypothetical protein